MSKYRKGISAMALIAAVSIIAILVTTVTISGIDTANNAKKISFGTEIYMIQSAVDAYYTKNNATFPVKDTVVLTISNPTADVRGQFSLESGMSNNKITLYEIDYNQIGIDSLKYGRGENGEKDMYVLSKETGRVYYAMGLKISGKTYFTNTDDIDNLLNYNKGKNTVNSPMVLFEPSTTDWAPSVSVDVKIPSSYTVNSVKVNDTTTLAVSTTKDNYNIYTYSSNSSNYYITVSYKETSTGSTKTARYSVNNIDSQAPNLTIGNKVKLEGEDFVGYVKIITKVEDLSGIKTIKYDYGDFTNTSTAKAHFENNGIEATDDIIFIKPQYDKITVYVEDNAGNFRTLLVDAKI